MPDLFPVFYNLEPVTIGPIKNSALIMNVNSEKTVSNLKIDDKIFFLKSIYLYRQNNLNYLVQRLIADPINPTGEVLYLVAQIAYDVPKVENPFPIDTLLSATDAAPQTVTWDLNLDIKDGKGAKKFTHSGGTITILLDELSHVIKMTNNIELNLATTFYATAIPEIILAESDTYKATPAVMRKSIMDWNISCELQGEDEDSVDIKKNIQDITPYSTLLIMTSVAMAAAALYSTTPFIFTNMIIPLAEAYNKKNNTSGMPLFSISVIWNIALGLIILQLFILGALGSNDTFFYLFFGALIIWFLCNKAVKDKFGDLRLSTTMVSGNAINTGFFAMFEGFKFDIGTCILIFTVLLFIVVYSLGYNYLTKENIAAENRISLYFIFLVTMICSVVLILFSNAYSLDSEQIIHIGTYTSGAAVVAFFSTGIAMMVKWNK